MKTLIQLKSTLLLMLCFTCLQVFPQELPDSLQANEPNIEEVIVHKKGIAFELYNLRSGRKFILPENNFVRVYCRNSKGSMRLKRSRITRIEDGEITFTPTNKKFDEVSYSPESLGYIEFTTAGTIVRGIIVNTIIVSAIVVITTFMVMESILTGRSSGFINDFSWIPFDDFHKHIRTYNNHGDQKWVVRIIEVIQ